VLSEFLIASFYQELRIFEFLESRIGEILVVANSNFFIKSTRTFQIPIFILLDRSIEVLSKSERIIKKD
jgi:hypothetical protein